MSSRETGHESIRRLRLAVGQSLGAGVLLIADTSLAGQKLLACGGCMDCPLSDNELKRFWGKGGLAGCDTVQRGEVEAASVFCIETLIFSD